MRYFLLLCACIVATSIMAADTLYQKQRLQRQHYQRELNLKWQQRQDIDRAGARDPIEKQRVLENNNQQLLRQRRLHQSQQNKIERDKSSSERLYEQQKFKREQNSQDLELKWQQH